MSNQRVVGENNFIVLTSSGRSMRFITPIKKNSRGAQVYALRKFLGIPGNTDFFDRRTKEALMDWQDANKNAITELAGWQTEVGVGSVRLEIVADSSEWMGEYGQVGSATFVAIKNAGKTVIENASTGYRGANVNITAAPGMALDTAVEQTLAELAGKGAGTVDNPVAALGDAVMLSDVPAAPSADEQYYYYTYVSNDTRSIVGENVEEYIRTKSEEALRKGVDFVMTHYNKSKTWRIGGSDEVAQVYSELLQYQGRLPAGATIPRGQTYTFTIQPQPLAQSVGLTDGTSEPVIDVLFGQSLAEGAKTHFASIVKVHTPNLRPLSTFKWSIRVRRDMFDGASSSEDPIQSLKDDYERLKGYYEDGKEAYDALKSAPGKAQELAEDAREYIDDKVDAVSDALEYASENPWEATKKVGKAAYRAANALKRNAEKKALAELGISPGLTDAQRKALFADQLAKEISTDSLPAAVEYDSKMFMTRISAVADKMEEYAEKINEWKSDGGRITPNINLATEAGRLRSVVPPLTAFMIANGKNISPISSGKFRIIFDKVVKTKKINGSPQSVVVGSRPIGISWGDPSKKEELKKGTIGLFIASPFNNPRTMGYLMHLNEMYEKSEGGVLGIFCGDPSLGGLAMEFLMKYTYPSPSILASTPYGSEISVKINVYGAVKRAKEQLDERLTLIQNRGVGAVFKDGLYKVERGKTYNVTDFLPKFELCTLEQLYAEFLNKFDFWVLFCDYASCIPEVPWPLPFEWDFDFKIPPLPKIPSFDPIKFIIPRLEAMLVDLIIGFLCALVRAILDMIKIPNCHDLLAYGKAALDWIMKDRSSGEPGENTAALQFDPDRQSMTARERSKSMLKAKKAMDEMEIPEVPMLAVGEIFEQVSLALTPSELCSLLNGDATGEVIMIVRKIIISHPSDLKRYLNQEDEIEEFFSHLGGFIDPAICQTLSSYGDIVLGDVYCPDDADLNPQGGYNSLRKALEESGASNEEIRRALQDAQVRREALQALMKENPLNNVLPSKIGVGGLPGPYDNDHFSELLELTAKATFDTIEFTFKTDMRGYVPSFYSPIQRELTPEDPDYNHVGMAKHKFVAQQVLAARLKPTEKQIADAMMKIEKPGEIIFRLDENGEPTQYVKEIKPGVRIIKKESDGTLGLPKKKRQPDYFNLTEPGDLTAFEQFLMMPLNNIRAEIGVQPEYLKYLAEPRNNQVLIRTGKYPKYISETSKQQFVQLAAHLRATGDVSSVFREISQEAAIDTLSLPDDLEEQVRLFDTIIGEIQSGTAMTSDVISPLLQEIAEEGINFGGLIPGGSLEGVDLFEQVVGPDLAEKINPTLGITPDQFDNMFTPGWVLKLRLEAARVQYRQGRITNFLQNNLGKLFLIEKTGPQLMYRVRSVVSRPLVSSAPPIVQSARDFVDNFVSDADAINCQLIDHYFESNTPRDCFQIDRAPRFFEGRSKSYTEVDDLNTFYYSSDVSNNMLSIRLRAPDMATSGAKKLLRPEAFAQLVFESLERSVDLASGLDKDLYPSVTADGGNNLTLKDWNTSNNLWKNLTYSPATPNVEEEVPAIQPGHFSLLSQRFMDKIATSVSKSRFFNLEGLSRLNYDLTEEFVKKVVLDDNGEQKECLVKKKLLFDFVDLRKKAIKDFSSLSQTEKHDPKNRDFSDPGPVEEALIIQIISLYIKTFVGELVLKGLYIFSRFDAKHILQMPHIKEYIAEYIYITIEKDFRRTENYKTSFIDKIKEITNTDDQMESLKLMTEKVIENDENLISELATELFEPEYFSYKEEYFNELISKYLNSKTGIELLPFATRNYGQDVPRPVEAYYRRDGDGETVSMNNNEYLRYLYDVLHVERGMLKNLRPRLIALRFAYARHGAQLAAHTAKYSNLPVAFAPPPPELVEQVVDRYQFNSLKSERGETVFFQSEEKVEDPHIVDFQYLYSRELANSATRRLYEEALDEISDPRMQVGNSRVQINGLPTRRPDRDADWEAQDEMLPYKKFVAFKDWKDIKRSKVADRVVMKARMKNTGINFLEREEARISEKIQRTEVLIRRVYTDWHRSQVEQFRELNDRPGQSVTSWFDWSYTKDDTYKSVGAYFEVERVNKYTSSTIPLPDTIYKNKQYLDDFNTRIFKDDTLNYEAENTINSQLEKNSGYFMLENFFYVDNDREGSKTYLPDLLAKIMPYTTFETVTDGDTPGSVLVDNPDGDGTMINPDYHFMLSKRMSIADYEILLERLRRTRFALGNDNVPEEYSGKALKELGPRLTINDETFKNPVQHVISNTHFGIRLVYVPGYGDLEYENQVYENEIVQPEHYKYIYPQNPKRISENSGTVPFSSLDSIEGDVYGPLGVVKYDTTNLMAIDDFPNSIFKHEGSAIYMNDGYLFRKFQSQTKTGRAYLNQPITSTPSNIPAGLIRNDNSFETFTFELAVATERVRTFEDNCGNTISPAAFFDTDEGKFTNSNAGKKIAAVMKDALLQNLLGVTRDQRGVYRVNTSLTPQTNISLLFDDIFPLDRLSSLYFINEEGFFDKSTNFRDFLGATRATTRRVYRALMNKSDVQVGDEEQLDAVTMYGLINGSMGASGPDNRENSMVSEFLEDMVPQLIKAVLMAVPTMIRGLAVGFDPGFGAMKRTFEEDPCKLSDGMSWGSIKGPPYLFPRAHPLAAVGGIPTRQFDNGIDPQNPCDKTFAPMTFGAPVDIGLGAGWLVVEIIKSILGAGDPVSPALTLANSVQHLVNSVKGKETMSYGSFLGPVGMIALSMPQLPGEEPGKRQEEAGCDTKECDEQGDELPDVPDPCEEEE